jgi:hypothetical protein
MEIQNWAEDQEKDFAEAQNKNPKISTEDWLQRYIFADIHEIFFGGIHQELHEWLARLADTQFEIRSRPPVVWTLALIQKVKIVDNIVSRAIDHWFDSTIGGYSLLLTEHNRIVKPRDNFSRDPEENFCTS